MPPSLPRRSAALKSARLLRPPTQSRWVSYSLLLLNAICWGAGLIMVKPALEYTTPFRFLFYRYAIASLLASGFIWYYWGQIRHKGATLWRITQLELLGLTFTLALLYQGLAKTTATEASLIATTVPIFITLGGMWLLKERQEKHEWLGLSLALGGTLLLILWPNGHGSVLQFGSSASGKLLVIGHNVATALYFVLAKKYYQNWPKLFVAAVSFWIGLVSFAALSLMEVQGQFGTLWTALMADWHQPSVWVASGYMAIFGSIIGLTAYIKGQSGVEASEASLFWYLEPLVYLPLGALVLGEKIQVYHFVALGCIVAGVVIAELRRRRARR